MISGWLIDSKCFYETLVLDIHHKCEILYSPVESQIVTYNSTVHRGGVECRLNVDLNGHASGGQGCVCL